MSILDQIMHTFAEIHEAYQSGVLTAELSLN